MFNCDQESGACKISTSEEINRKIEDINTTIYYIGDPMCSWCWGFSSVLKEVQNFCSSNNIDFKLKLGGLRPGGGDAWNEGFKSFLKNEWQNISQRTGQKFTYTLLNKEHFNYDTTPVSKAVYIARILLNTKKDNDKTLLEFFSSIQEKFYAYGEDSTKLEFFENICEKYNISFLEFSNFFNSAEIEKEIYLEFNEARSLTSGGMPSLVMIKEKKKNIISAGYNTYENIIKEINKYIKD
ncbi:MAG: DsbA family protein [Aliarcobacter sp.]|nr:DsbA family protein [Aliarcobacter sp.]